MSDRKNVFTYEGKDADVVWDGDLCIHVGECGRADGDLFVTGRKPWCQPDLSTVADVTELVKRCPTGALTAVLKDGEYTETPESKNRVVVANNGPLYASGDLDIEGAADDQPSLKFRAALCRCGHSANKPFCDNGHETQGFVDRGAIGNTGDAEPHQAGSALQVTCRPNGPLFVSGSFELVAGSGRVAWKGTKTALCRCGQSGNKPFCDGAHKRAGFTTE